jgi:hypothetical protein
MTTDRAVERLIDKASGDSDVLAVLLFGSRARGESVPGSDADICLVLADGAKERVEISQKKLEYLGLGDLDVQVFQQLPLYVRQRVLADGRILHVKDVDGLYELAFRTVREFEDFRHEYDEYLRVIARA